MTEAGRITMTGRKLAGLPVHPRLPRASRWRGSKIRIDYRPDEPPVLAVRLQEMFGETVTPTVCGGRVPLFLHLLSPARRPIQVTSDLGSFWQRSYPEVKKELKGRYPKHFWPDDPLTAEAVRGVKKKHT